MGYRYRFEVLSAAIVVASFRLCEDMAQIKGKKKFHIYLCYYLPCSLTHTFYIRLCISTGADGLRQNQLYASCEPLCDGGG